MPIKTLVSYNPVAFIVAFLYAIAAAAAWPQPMTASEDRDRSLVNETTTWIVASPSIGKTQPEMTTSLSTGQPLMSSPPHGCVHGDGDGVLSASVLIDDDGLTPKRWVRQVISIPYILALRSNSSIHGVNTKSWCSRTLRSTV